MEKLLITKLYIYIYIVLVIYIYIYVYIHTYMATYHMHTDPHVYTRAHQLKNVTKKSRKNHTHTFNCLHLGLKS
jgi:hypothetical protein